MGNDGGSIPRRGDMVRTKARSEAVEKDQLSFERWRLCSLSMEPLQRPIVACRLGKLYNKEAVVTYLLDRSSYGELSEAFSHITGLRDVTVLNLTENAAYVERAGEATKQQGRSTDPGSRFVCPVTGREMNGSARFFYFQTCGCVISEQAYREVPGDAETCLKCSKPATAADRVPINGTAEETEQLRQRILADRRRKPAKRKTEVLHASSHTGSGEILALKRNKNIDELYTR